MTKNLPKECTMISDTDAPEAMEQTIIVANYDGSDGIGLIGYDGDEVYVPYRMVKEVCKVMLAYQKNSIK